MTTSYRTIPNFPDYRVGDDGTVWSRKNNRWGIGPWKKLRLVLRDGRVTISLHRDGTQITCKVHHLVLNSFVGPQPKGKEALHSNGDASNNRFSNLRWGTKQENWEDSLKHGTALIGEKHPGVKLKSQEVQKVRRLYGSGCRTQQSLATEFGVSKTLIGRIVRMEMRKHE